MASDTLSERDGRTGREREIDIDMSRPHQEIEGQCTSKTHKNNGPGLVKIPIWI